MKWFLFIVCIYSLTMIIYAQPTMASINKNDVQISGVTKEIRTIKNGENILSNYLVINLSVNNSTKRDILIVPSEFRVSGGVINDGNGQLLGHYSNYSPSKVKSLSELENKFNKKSPNLENVIILKPGEKWNIEGLMNLDTNLPISDPSKTLERLKSFSKLFVIVKCQFASPLFENKKLEKSDSFWFGLQKRWNRYGHLLIGDVDSEPIPLDLSSAVVKTN